MDVEIELVDEKPPSVELCRLCANSDKDFIPIFQGEGIEHNIAERIKKYLPIVKVTEGDALPLQICYQCTSTLLAWHNFFEHCHVADNRLRELFSENFEFKQDDESDHDFTDDFHHDFEDQAVINDEISDNTEVETIRPALTVGNAQLVEISDNETVNSSKDISKSATKNLDDNRIAQPQSCASKKYRCVMCPKKTTTKTEMGTHIAERHSFLKLATQTEQNDDSTVTEKTAPASEKLAIIKANLKTKPSLNDEIAAVRKKRLKLLEKTTIGDLLMRSDVKSVPSAEIAPLWQCLACRQRFVDKMDLQDHVQLKHVESEQNKNGPLKLRMLGHCCEVCGRCFDELEYMIGHHLVMHPDANPPSFKYLQSSTDWAMLCFTCLLYYRRSEIWFTNHNCTNSIDLEAMEKTRSAVAVDPCFLCDVCAATFRYKCAYQYHREVLHKGVSEVDWHKLQPATIPYVCEKCDKGFLKLVDFRAHVCDTAADGTVPPRKKTLKVPCAQCSHKFSSVEAMRRHVRTQHALSLAHGRKGRVFRPENPTIRCPFCEDLKFMTCKDMLAHAKEVHNEELRNPYYCAKCNKEFSSNTKLNEHCEAHDGGPEDEKMVTEVCKLAERTKDDTVFYECPDCHHKFVEPMEYFWHYRRHQLKREFTCDRCGRSMPSNEALGMHMRSVHRETPRRFACDQCDSVLCSRFSLREHQAAIHNTERPFMCERCGKHFPTKVRLQVHQRCHLFGPQRRFSQGRFTCALCSKDFKKKETLRNHLKVHSGIKDVACPECGQLFYSKLAAYFHKLHVHCTERPFKCDTCEASFPLRSYLTRHMKKHEEKTPTNASSAQNTRVRIAVKKAAQEREATNSETAQSFST